jgi:hypothetical protein
LHDSALLGHVLNDGVVPPANVAVKNGAALLIVSVKSVAVASHGLTPETTSKVIVQPSGIAVVKSNSRTGRDAVTK